MKRNYFFSILIIISINIAAVLLGYYSNVKAENSNLNQDSDDNESKFPSVIPGRSIFNSSILRSPERIELNPGETKELDLILETKGDGPGKFTYTVLGKVKGEYSEQIIPTPYGLSVTIEPSEFNAYQNETYTSVIRIETSETLQSGEYYFYFSAVFENEFLANFWLFVKVS